MIVGVDANGHVGNVREWTAREWDQPGEEARHEDYYPIGEFGAETENANGTLMREFLGHTNMIAANTTDPMASGKTWYGGKGGATRVDYILIDQESTQGAWKVWRSTEMHRRLRTLVGLEVMDHVPMGWRGRLPRWTPPERRRGWDTERMVRSCLTWDAQAITYGQEMQQFLQTQWLDRAEERAADPREPIDKMADMAWKLEDHMNQTAKELWPSRVGGYTMMYAPEDKRWLK